ncbi:hypothetical protein GCM10028806_19540 [Spirosoma terrae]|uniref:Uncharacterized protein n=1 Tax=Spirosoma terrae TaxID=1968276 RepID=A0A6L9LD20_9BACT|nr:hypothetical protein [Spirosoma terrae]NDU94729.1 hypothetical protein [Spirosoma terrae]
MNEFDEFYMSEGWSYDDVQSYRDFYESEGYAINSPSDPKLTADLTVAKDNATASGNTKLANTLDFILKYGDKALSILTKNGIIKNQNLVASYPSYASLLGTGTTDTTNNAPSASNRVFNIDFTDPKVLIITFLLLLILFYFLFFNPKSNAKR